jgi:hypothetical protein
VLTVLLLGLIGCHAMKSSSNSSNSACIDINGTGKRAVPTDSTEGLQEILQHEIRRPELCPSNWNSPSP